MEALSRRTSPQLNEQFRKLIVGAMLKLLGLIPSADLSKLLHRAELVGEFDLNLGIIGEHKKVGAALPEQPTFPAGALTRERMNQIAQAAQNDPTCSRIEVFPTCRRERSYALCRLLMSEPCPHGSGRWPTVLLTAKTYGSVFYDKLTPSIARGKW